MILTATQQTAAAFTVQDAKGNPARVDGVPEWASSDPNVATVTPSADGFSAVVKAVQTGETQVSVTVDADLGEGVRPLIGVGDIEVVAGEATVIALQFGPAEQQ